MSIYKKALARVDDGFDKFADWCRDQPELSKIILFEDRGVGLTGTFYCPDGMRLVIMIEHYEPFTEPHQAKSKLRNWDGICQYRSIDNTTAAQEALKRILSKWEAGEAEGNWQLNTTKGWATEFDVTEKTIRDWVRDSSKSWIKKVKNGWLKVDISHPFIRSEGWKKNKRT